MLKRPSLLSRTRRVTGSRLRVESLEDRSTPSAGSLDTSFGMGGAYVSPLAGAGWGGPAVAEQPSDQKLVVASNFSMAGQPDYVTRLSRYNPDGSLDTSFGSGGSVVNVLCDQPTAIAAIDGGDILVAGASNPNLPDRGYEFFLARYLPNGDLDSSFGDPSTPGMTITDFGVSGANAMQVLSDGSILLGGSGAGGFAIVHYNSNGVRDQAFGGGTGFASLPNGGQIYDLAIQSDGAIVAVGPGGPDRGQVLARFTSDGLLDNSFNHGQGWVSQTFYDNRGDVYTRTGGFWDSVSIQDLTPAIPNDSQFRIVTTGVGFQETKVFGYTTSGDPDPSFASDGTLDIPLSSGVFRNVIDSIAQPDGKLLLIGQGDQSSEHPYDFSVARLTLAGQFDPSFSGDGVTQTDFGGGDQGYRGVLESDGKLVVVGWSFTDTYHLAMARYESDKVDQSIDFGPVADKIYGDDPFAISATASSGLAVSFSIVSGPATISGNTITITGAGTVIVRAWQAGNDEFKPATDVDRSFVVGKAMPTVIVTGGSYVFDGQPHPATGSVTGVGGENLGTPTFTYTYQDGDANWVPTGNNGSDIPVEPGYYRATGSFAGNANYNLGTATAYVTIAYDAHTLTDLSKAFHAGRTIPIKLELTDANGNNLSSSDIDLSAIRLERVNADGTRTEVALQDAGNSNPGNLFRYDSSIGGYIFNLSTKNLGAGTYDFFWTAEGDPTEHSLRFWLI